MKALVARKRLEAPFDGIVGIRQVNIGQYLQPGAPIVPLQSMDPIHVEFALPQQNLSSIAVGKKLQLTAAGTECAPISKVKSPRSIRGSMKRLATSWSRGRSRTPSTNLRPGMFVDVEVLLPEEGGRAGDSFLFDRLRAIWRLGLRGARRSRSRRKTDQASRTAIREARAEARRSGRGAFRRERRRRGGQLAVSSNCGPVRRWRSTTACNRGTN